MYIIYKNYNPALCKIVVHEKLIINPYDFTTN